MDEISYTNGMKESQSFYRPSLATSIQHGDAGEEKREPSKQWGHAFKTFCGNTTFHGLRNVANSTSHVAHRILWTTIVLTSTAIFCYQCQNLIRLYFRWPVRMTISMSRQEPVDFPAVTICNQNAFKLVVAAEDASYRWLDDMYNRTNNSTFDYTRWGVGNMSMRDVYLRHAHHKEDMIASCRWKGMPCSHEDFKLTVTDAGVCYTFNAHISANSKVNATGAKNGLQLVVNVEQYEYMKGPHNAVGLKLHLHHQDDVPQVEDFGDNIPAGMHTFVAITVTKETNLPPPHGDCTNQQKLRYFGHYSQAACYRECIADFVVKTCGCRDYYMPPFNTDEPLVCNVSRYTSCLLPAIESFNKNRSASCVCHKECSTLHHKTSMSYAAVNENSESQFDLSEEFLWRTRKHLNESLDTRERLLPDRRHTNIEEADRVIRGLPTLIGTYFQYSKFARVTDMFIANFNRSYNIIIELGIQKMKDVLYNTFSVVWDQMNLYDCMAGSFELFAILGRSVNMTDQYYWRPTLRLRLEASKRALYNLGRVHDAYCNIVPLLNYTVTPNGKYDSFYLTPELFKQSTNINDTYIRIRGHLKDYIENIDGLFRMYIADDHKIAIQGKFLNYSNGVLEASVEYNRDLRLYESLVIREPLQQIIKVRNIIENHKTRVMAKRVDCQGNWFHFKVTQDILLKHGQKFNNTNTTGNIAIYLENLKYNRHASILQLANSLTSDTITQLVEQYKELFSRRYELFGKFLSDLLYFGYAQCKCHKEAEEMPLLKALYAKLYDYYKVSSDPEKAAMREYFKFKDDNSVDSALFRGTMSRMLCRVANVNVGMDLPRMEESSLRNLTTFKKRLDAFLQTTRLDGTFFSRNFLELNIYMRDLRIQKYEQLEAYALIDLLSDIGGSMGLLIGASIITLFEAVDAFVITLTNRQLQTNK